MTNQSHSAGAAGTVSGGGPGYRDAEVARLRTELAAERDVQHQVEGELQESVAELHQLNEDVARLSSELAAERAKREAAEAENAELWDALHLWENAFGTARDENLSHARLHALSLMERDTAP